MGFVTFKQADSRWGSLNYNGSSTMAAAGCGPTSCAILLSGFRKKITPIKTMKYMQEHGYAVRNHGTAWDGIPACLKAFGMEDVRAIDVSSSMVNVWAALKKGYVAVFLFSAGSRGGVCWTTSGHFVAVTDYKYDSKSKKHKLYTRDPGSRNHTGWYCYETHMRGLIPKVWVCKLPGKKLSKNEKICLKAIECSYAYGTKKSKYAMPDGKPKKAYKHALERAYPYRNSWSVRPRHGRSCDVAVGVFVRDSGVDKKFPRGLDEVMPYVKSSRGKKFWKRKKNPKLKDLIPGDVIYQIFDSGVGHISVYIGNGKVANAHYYSNTYPIIERYSSKVRPASGCRSFYRLRPRG